MGGLGRWTAPLGARLAALHRPRPATRTVGAMRACVWQQGREGQRGQGYVPCRVLHAWSYAWSYARPACCVHWTTTSLHPPLPPAHPSQALLANGGPDAVYSALRLAVAADATEGMSWNYSTEFPDAV